MRARFVTRENLVKLFGMVASHLDPDHPTLVYILTQSDRIGHLALEPQVLKTLYGARYKRIVVVTGRMDRPGTNPALCDCFGDGFVFVETDDPVILSMGYLDGGLADLQRVHLLLQSPRALIVECWQRVAAGEKMSSLSLPEHIVDASREKLSAAGLDPQAPFAVFHMRTMQYLPTLSHHSFRTASVEHFLPSVQAVLDAGYQVVRIGEPDLPLSSGALDGYVSLPDAVPHDRSVDLYAMAHADFGVIQNSGPMVVLAGFQCRTLRTNLPLEHLTLAYNNDLMLFKEYQDSRTGRLLHYDEILERRLPSLNRSEELAEQGVELVENEPETLLAATKEILGAVADRWLPDHARNAKFFELGAAYEAEIGNEPWFEREHMDFYAYAHPLGAVTTAFFERNPAFLD